MCTVNAALLVYATEQAKWVPQGPGNGMSRIYLYKNEATKSYRIVSRNTQDKQVRLRQSPLLTMEGQLQFSTCEINHLQQGDRRIPPGATGRFHLIMEVARFKKRVRHHVLLQHGFKDLRPGCG